MNSIVAARNIRIQTLKMINTAQTSHLGSCFSVVDLLSVLYTEVLRFKPGEPDWPERDYLIFSKGHAAAALYATLGEVQILPPTNLDQFCIDESYMAGHVNHWLPGIEVSTGSLGHGLAIACGLAIGLKQMRKENLVYIILGDGELNEGSIWEAVAFASHHKLDNLTALLDVNQMQGLGPSKQILSFNPLVDKWCAFGWAAQEIDGHDHQAIHHALEKEKADAKPRVIIAHTVKGKGVDFMEDDNFWHYHSPSNAEYNAAMQQLSN